MPSEVTSVQADQPETDDDFATPLEAPRAPLRGRARVIADRRERIAQQRRARTDYGTGAVRQTIFALSLLALLPFAVGMVVMIVRRVSDGLWYDLPALMLLACGIGAVMAMLAFELLFSIRARLVLGKMALRFTLPKNGAAVPLWSYASHDIPYHAIKGVELRREVFGGKIAPVLLRGLVIKTKDNKETVVGHTLEGFEDPAFPFAMIGDQIAARAAVPLVDQRTIWIRRRSDRSLEYISHYDTDTYILDPAEEERLNVAHRRIMLGLTSALAAIVLLGLLAEFASGA
ncbi:MAG: hypothetical protein AB7S74_15670 [Hyphomicrobium sp.]